MKITFKGHIMSNKDGRTHKVIMECVDFKPTADNSGDLYHPVLVDGTPLDNHLIILKQNGAIQITEGTLVNGGTMPCNEGAVDLSDATKVEVEP